MAKISIHNLTKRYGNMTALKNVSLEIDNGEFLVLLGPSGCGKTTLLRCLAGLETPDEGEIIIGDEVIFSSEQKIMQPPGKRNLGMVFQSYALWPHMTVWENVKFALDVLKTPKETSDRRLDEVLKKLSMDSLSERYPSELSGGQQQRVALARLLATKPPVFLMDEPLSNLDARLRMDMRVELKRFQSDAGATTVYVTHDQTEAMTMSTRVVVMKNGEIQQISPPSELYKKPNNTFVADFIGMPRINLVELHGSGQIFSNGDITVNFGWEPGVKSVVLGARPEDLTISPNLKSIGETYTVTAVLPNGPEIIVQLQKGKTVIIGRVGHDSIFENDQEVKVTYAQASLNVYDASTRELISPIKNN